MLCRQRLNAFGLYKITKIRVKSQNTGEVRAILPNVRIYGQARINMGDFFTLELI